MMKETDITSLDLSGCGASEPFALRVLGDSMEPEFQDGCIVLVDPAGVCENRSYVLAMLNGEYIFRQLIIDGQRYLLTPLNDGYDTVETTRDAIQGVIVQKAGTRRRDRKHYV